MRTVPFEWNSWSRLPYEAVPSALDAAARARDVRQRLLGRAWREPLPDLAPFCRAAGVSAFRADLGASTGGPEALLMPAAEDRFDVFIDTEPLGGWQTPDDFRRRLTALRRLRFRIGHELAHTFFFWREGGRPRRCLGDSPAQERFCDRFAAELLLPSAVARSVEAEPASLCNLAERYGMSLQATLRSIADAQPTLNLGLWNLTPSGPVAQALHGHPAIEHAVRLPGADQLLAVGG